MQVLDSSAFILDYEPSDDVASVEHVRGELEDSSRFRFDAMEGSGMHVHVPEEHSRERVRGAAEDTGDADVLSDVDVEVLATALELDAEVVTDDYAMQNVADELQVEVETVGQSGIEERRDWIYQCQGCGRESEQPGDCVVCGTEKTRKNPS